MRLLSAMTLDFHEFEGSNIPEYAILSHRWEGGEVTFQDMQDLTLQLRSKTGFAKVQNCCRQAVRDGYDYVWVDTCCIDKTSSAELSEAINSMYQWYRNSAVCYAYLSDVRPETTYKIRDATDIPAHEDPSTIAQIKESKWWTRGWTLQELIAPRIIKFFGSGSYRWIEIGDKSTLLDLIVQRSGIHRDILLGTDLRQCSIAMRMSWISDRETTRSEDMAYCLLGIFGVNMPLLYGEGEKAFLRLQEEIMKQSDDQTLFAWELNPDDITAELRGPLATSPSMFRGCSELIPIPDSDAPTPYSMTNKGLRFELPIVRRSDQRRGIAILQCCTTATFPRRLTLPIIQANPGENSHFARDGRYTYSLRSVESSEIKHAVTKTIFMKQEHEQRVLWRSEFLVRQHGMVEDYRQLFTNPTLFDRTLFTGMTEKDSYTQIFGMPSGKPRGAIIYGDIGPDVLVLFNIEMKQRGRFSCKVLSLDPRSTYSETSLPGYRHVQESLSGIKNNIMDYIDYRDNNRAVFIDRRLEELHAFYTAGSDSRISSSSLKYEQDMAVFASIGPQIIAGQISLVLDVTRRNLSEVPFPFCELYGDVSEEAEDAKTRRKIGMHKKTTD